MMEIVQLEYIFENGDISSKILIYLRIIRFIDFSTKTTKKQIKNHQYMYWWRRWESNPRPDITALKLLRV